MVCRLQEYIFLFVYLQKHVQEVAILLTLRDMFVRMLSHRFPIKNSFQILNQSISIDSGTMNYLVRKSYKYRQYTEYYRILLQQHSPYKGGGCFLKERQTCFYYSTTKVHRTETYSSQHTQRPTERTPLPPAPKAAAASATGWRPLQDDEPLLLAKKQPCQYRLQGHLCVEADATAALVLAMQYVESSSDNCLSLTHSRQLES